MGKEQDLLDASRSGQLAIVEKILASRVKKGGLNLTSLRRLPGPNTTDPRNGFTCLHYASLNGHKNIVRLLLQHGANPNIEDHNGSSPLHLASWTGDYEVVELLITNQSQIADINLKNKDVETALHSACQYGHTAVVSLLLTQGADPSVRNIRLETPLDLAAQYGRLETLELLLRMRFDLLNEYLPGRSETNRPVATAHSPLHLASRNGHKTVVKLLLELGFDVDYLTQNGTALHEAVLCGKVDVVRILLDAGSDIYLENDRGQKVEELLNGLNTPVAKQTLKLIQDHIQSMANQRVSPLSESTTLGASFCDQEDLTIVDSMLNEDIVLYNHDFEDLLDESEVQCISPPPGYTDNTPEHGPGEPLECISPSSSLFSASILSELASIFDEHLNRTSTDEQRTSGEFTEGELLKIKPSTSFTLNDYRSGHSVERYSHHQSFDAVYHNDGGGIPEANNAMSSSFNTKIDDHFCGLKRDDPSRDSIVSSNYSISSVASSSLQSSTDGGHRSRPPKPPRKSIELSKAKSIECARGLQFKNVEDNLNAISKVDSNEQVDSDHSTSQHLSSVISNDVIPAKKANSTNEKHSSTLAQSIDDFYLLYDQVAAARSSKSPDVMLTKHSSLDLLDDRKSPLPKQSLDCPEPEQAQNILHSFIGPHKEKYEQSQTVHLCQRHQLELEQKSRIQIDSWTVTEESGQPVTPPGQYATQRRSVGVSALITNGTPKRKSLRKRKSTEHRQQQQQQQPEVKPKKSDHFSAYCETLKFDRKGEKENPFAGLCRGGLTPAKKVTKSVKKKTVELSEARKSLRRQRNILSGRAESLTKLSKLSVYNDNGTDFANQYQQLPHNNNIYGTLRRNKKKSKSLNGDHLLETNKTTTTTTTTNESSQDSEQMVPNGTEIKTPKRSASVTGEALLGEILPVGEYHKQVERWLKDLLLPQYKELLINNGYDNLNFMDNNVMDDSSLLEIGIINACHRDKIVKTAKLQLPPMCKLSKKEFNSLSIDQWLEKIHLQQYTAAFHSNGFDELKKIRSVWEVELETTLDIEMLGHRKRIMYSISDFNRDSILLDDEITTWLTENVNTNTVIEKKKDEETKASWKGWKHARHELVSGCCQYVVSYLGSTLVRELRGIDSTRASIGKLKTANLASIPMIVLAISCQGVQFIDSKTNKLICEHEIRNIHCICQDSEDLNYFAYITKDFESNNHYCHVFVAPKTELVTEIILTLGQAFEIAYQIVLEQYNLVQANASGRASEASYIGGVGGGSESLDIDSNLSDYRTYVKVAKPVEETNGTNSKDKPDLKPVDQSMEPPPPVAEDIYAVVDKRRKIKTRLQQFEALVAESSNKQQQQQPLEQKPVPPVRSSSTNSNSSTQSLSGYRPEIKPKPPLRVASMRKPEISPKPKNLQPRVAVGKSPTPSTPTPPPPPIEARRTKTLQNMSSTTLLPSTNTFY